MTSTITPPAAAISVRADLPGHEPLGVPEVHVSVEAGQAPGASFYDRCAPRLEALVRQATESRSVDEGTSHIFDGIIQGWLDEEVARLRRAHATEHAQLAHERTERQAARARHDLKVAAARQRHDDAVAELEQARARLTAPAQGEVSRPDSQSEGVAPTAPQSIDSPNATGEQA